MSEDLLSEYKAYYSVRAEKYAGNKNYSFSYEAEKALSNAMQSCGKLEEFRTAIGDLNERCAVALVKDEAVMEREHFRKHKEDVRIKASLEILDKADQFNEVMNLITMVNEAYNRNMLEITADEAHRQLYHDWDLVDRIDIYTQAVVPDKYKKDMLATAEHYRKSLRQNAEGLTKEILKYVPEWRMDPEKVKEFRNRRLCPFADHHIEEQLRKYKEIINA